MVHAGLPVLRSAVGFPITAEREPLRPAFDLRGIGCKPTADRGSLHRFLDAHDAASAGCRGRSARKKPSRLAAKLRGAMMVARTPRHARRPFAGTLSRSEQGGTAGGSTSLDHVVSGPRARGRRARDHAGAADSRAV